MNVTPFLFVFIGGGLGSVVRYSISRVFSIWSVPAYMPLSTFVSNMLASILLAALVVLGVEQKSLSENQISFWMIGFCGGFSTFSTFSLENWQLYKSGAFIWLAANVLVSVLLGLFCFVLIAKNFNASMQ